MCVDVFACYMQIWELNGHFVCVCVYIVSVSSHTLAIHNDI